MRAREIAEMLPTVTLGASVASAVRVMARSRQPGLIVVDDHNKPRVVLPGTQVLRMTMLTSYQEEPALARAIDEAHADQYWQEARGRAVADCLPAKAGKPFVVHEDATLLEVAALMAREHTPLVAVVNTRGVLTGAITLNRVLSELALTD